MNQELIAEVRTALRTRADPETAPQMQRYMKSEMPYLGVASPGQRAAFHEVFLRFTLGSFEEWEATVRALWRQAECREERYAAIGLTGDGRCRPHQCPQTMPLYEEMIVTGAWWDYVDAIAIHRIGPILVGHSEVIGPLMMQWADYPHMWKRRTAIICQVLTKHACDAAILMACIEPNLADRPFFIRKAIGRALRDFARLNPAAVRVYVDDNVARLSPLSRREAEKGIARAQRARLREFVVADRAGPMLAPNRWVFQCRRGPAERSKFTTNNRYVHWLGREAAFRRMAPFTLI